MRPAKQTRLARTPRALMLCAALAAAACPQLAAAEAPPAEAPVQEASPQPAPVQPERVVRNVVVAQFSGDDAAGKARSAVLRALAEHAEVEVVSMDDVSFASQRFKADARTPEGRAKLSGELGVHAWLDGAVDDDTARLTLSAADGSKLGEVEIEASDSKQLDVLAGTRMWDAFGPRLSPYESQRREVLAAERAQREAVARAEREQREALERAEREQREALERGQRAQRAVSERVERAQREAAEQAEREQKAQPERARKKFAARVAEAGRQRKLAQESKAARSGQRALAQRKLSARLAEVARQAELVKRHEGGRLAKADPGPATAALPEPRPASPAREPVAAPLTNTSGMAAEAHAEKVPAAGISPATARWLAEQQAMGFKPAPVH